MALNPTWRRRIRVAAVTLVVLGGLLGFYGWYQFFREVPQPEFADDEMRFKYGSFGTESDRGIPYWIWVVLPRIFPEKLPGPGGYKSFGFAWEPGQELPIGFAKKTVGFPRVTNNYALCHAAAYRTGADAELKFVATGPSHTADLQKYIRFISATAKDPKFNADVILGEIETVYKLPWYEKLAYRFVIIPFTRKALREQERQFAWMNLPHWTPWGPGRDDPMNLTKYFMTGLPVDKTLGNADFPSIWNLKIREGKSLNWDGATPTPRSVIIDSGLGLGAPPGAPFLRQMDALEAWLKALPPPPFPKAKGFEIDAGRAAEGRAIYDRECASCHDPGGKRVGTVIDIAEIKTDRERLDTWTQQAADLANAKVKSMGIDRVPMVKTNGYVSPPLDGIWLRAPYLHNGAVPSLRDLLKPPAERTPAFYRGYDLYDPKDVGFVSQGPEAVRRGSRFDTKDRGNGNGGHDYGTGLPPEQKDVLLEYLKTL